MGKKGMGGLVEGRLDLRGVVYGKEFAKTWLTFIGTSSSKLTRETKLVSGRMCGASGTLFVTFS